MKLTVKTVQLLKLILLISIAQKTAQAVAVEDFRAVVHPVGVGNKFGPWDSTKPVNKAKKSKALLFNPMRTPVDTTPANSSDQKKQDAESMTTA